MKYFWAIVAALIFVGLVYFDVHYEMAQRHHPIPAPSEQPAPDPFPPSPPVVPDPEPAPAPVKPHRHKCHLKHGYYFHGQRCSEPWIMLPGSVKCMPSGKQFLVDELEWSIPKR